MATQQSIFQAIQRSGHVGGDFSKLESSKLSAKCPVPFYPVSRTAMAAYANSFITWVDRL